LQHPRIVEVVDYGVDRKQGPYYTMELLDGQDLKELGKVDPAQACRRLRDVAAALAFVHTRGLLHRDLSPRNIRCTADGHSKLLDFGVMATFGVVDDIAGTPPLIAPENVRGLPLDHRADLFGLGALAYWMLTGRHAYPARTIPELQRLWRKPVPPPSQLAEGISQPLDELVMSLLCLDPLGRPANAAEVIHRLAAIGELEPSPEIEVGQGYLNSASLVGRSSEMNELRRAANAAVEGEGHVLLIEAPSGTGKTRLLRELGLEAQVAGSTVILISGATAQRGPYGLMRDAVKAILDAVPEQATQIQGLERTSLPRLFPELRQRLGIKKPPAGTGDAAEQRLQAQRDLLEWILEIVRVRPLTVLVDDVQRCDEASAAALAALARSVSDRSLLLAVALRSDEEVRAPMPVAAVLDAATRIRLAGLDQQSVEDLVDSLFGGARHAKRLAGWMHRATAGSPLHCIELAQHLVERGVVRYADGEWVIPSNVHERPPPVDLAESMDARVAQLSEQGLGLAKVLALHGGTFSLERALALAGQDDETTFALLDELLSTSLLVGAGSRYHYRHDGLREAVLRTLDETEKKRLHLRVAEVLAQESFGDPEREAEIGWHFLEGGDSTRGARLLESAGRRLFEAQALRDCIPALEVAVTERVRDGAPLGIIAPLRAMLLSAGFYSDRRVALRHAKSTVLALRRYCGVDLADRLGPYLGRHLGLLVALTVVSIRWIVTPRARRGPSPAEAVATFMMTTGYACALQYIHFQRAELEEYVAGMRPLGIFKKTALYAGYLGTSAFQDLERGRYYAAKEKLEQGLSILRNDRLTPLPDYERRAGEGGMLGLIAFVQVFELDCEVERTIAEMERLDLRYYDLAAQTTRVTYLRMCGHELRARAVEAGLESMALQLGTWSIDLQLLTFATPAYALCRDILGIKRCLEAFAEYVAEGIECPQIVAFLRGEYHRERGELDEAKEAVRDEIPRYEDGHQGTLMYMLFSLADTQLALGELDAAIETAQRTLSLARRVGDAIPQRMRSVRTIALAEAALGDHESAARRLDEAIKEAKKIHAASLTGMLHEARARVAFIADDERSFHTHALATAHCFNATKNPALIAVSERLKHLEDVTPGSSETDAHHVVLETVSTTGGGAVGLASEIFDSCRGPSERGQKALELLVELSGARSGFLFLVDQDDRMTQVAPQYGQPPTNDMVEALADFLGDSHGGEWELEETVRSPHLALDAATPTTAAWKPMPLELDLDGHTTVVGGLILVEGSTTLRVPHHDLVHELALELYKVGDVSVVSSRRELHAENPRPRP
jgi:tetratricopeptide (TPR) repeat protein